MGKFIYMVSYIDCMDSGLVYQKFFTTQTAARDFVKRMNVAFLRDEGYDELAASDFSWGKSDDNNTLARVYSSERAAKEFDWTNYWRVDKINPDYFVGNSSDNFDIGISI